MVVVLLQGGSYEGEWRGGDREGIGIRTMRSGKVLAGIPLIILKICKTVQAAPRFQTATDILVVGFHVPVTMSVWLMGSGCQDHHIMEALQTPHLLPYTTHGACISSRCVQYGKGVSWYASNALHSDNGAGLIEGSE